MDIHIGGVRQDGKGVGVLRWSDGKPLTRELTRLELKPGESKTIEMTWIPDERFDKSIMGVTVFLWYSDDEQSYNMAGGLPVTVGWTGPGPFP